MRETVMTPAQFTKQYIALMQPLVPPKRIAFEIFGEAERCEDVHVRDSLVQIAAEHQLHRKTRHAPVKIVLRLEPGVNFMDGCTLIVHQDSMTLDAYVKRFVMLIVMVVCALALWKI